MKPMHKHHARDLRNQLTVDAIMLSAPLTSPAAQQHTPTAGEAPAEV